MRAAGFEIRVALGDPDPQTTSMLERNLRLTPAERLANAVLATRFVQKARAALQTPAMADAAFNPERIFAALADSEVRFVLIGGMAAILHGDAGVTMDVDIAPAYEHENLDRLATALRGIRARIRAEGARDGLPFDCSAEFLRNLGPDGILNLTPGTATSTWRSHRAAPGASRI